MAADITARDTVLWAQIRELGRKAEAGLLTGEGRADLAELEAEGQRRIAWDIAQARFPY